MAKPKPSWPTRTPGWRMTRLPRKALSTVAVGPIEQSRPIRTCGPITAWAPITVPDPISASGPITAPGSTVTPCSRRAVGWTKEPGDTPAAPKPDQGPHRRREQTGKRLGERLVGLRRHEGDGARRNLGRRSAARRGRRRPGSSPAPRRIPRCPCRRDRPVRRSRAARRRRSSRCRRRRAAASIRASAAMSATLSGSARGKKLGFGHGDLRREIRQRQGPALRRAPRP